MRKIELRMNEEEKYEVIKKLVDSDGNKNRAAIKLDCSRRTVNRMIKGYKENGKEFFIHGNRGRKPVLFIDETIRNRIIDLYITKYYDANFKHFSELLSKEEDLNYSVSAISNILKSNDILSPKARRSTKKRYKQNLKKALENTTSPKAKAEINYKLLELEQQHSRRPRCAFMGEMIQMDASNHIWFGDTKTHLHAAIDDATGKIVGATFTKEETLAGYYEVTRQILVDYGIPYMFYTDRRTVFEYKQKKNPSIEKDTFTQFSYACHQLGIEIKTSSIPQAKGRIERLFNTLQSRLPIELRLKGVTTIDQANEFLDSYICEFNKSFSLCNHNTKSVFDTQINSETINQTLAIISQRKVDTGHCIKYDNKHYKLVSASGQQVCFYSKTPVTVIKTLDKRLLAGVNDDIYDLEMIPEHERKSKYFGLRTKPDENVKSRTIPSMKHPWKIKTISKFVKENIKHFDHTFDELMYSQHDKSY